MICDPWDVVVVPFPFSERAGEKKRPALVLSTRSFNRAGHSALTMITTAARRNWPGDHELRDWRKAGLSLACTVRLKLFTIDNRLLLKRIGSLSAADRAAVAISLQKFLVTASPSS